MDCNRTKTLKQFVAATLIGLPCSAFAQDGLPPVVMDNKLAIAIGIFIYLLPAWIAWSRSHQNKGPIILINIFLGWTIIGWIIALLWSVGAVKKDTVVVIHPSGTTTPTSTTTNPSVTVPVASKTIAERIADLKAMLDAGAISQTEIDLLKADALKAIS